MSQHLSSVCAAGVDGRLDELLDAGVDPGDPAFAEEARGVAGELPAELRDGLAAFRTERPAAACVITGLSVDDASLGPTPPRWQDAAVSGASRREELALGLIAAELGEPVSWPSLQAGRPVRYILPTKGYENTQSGHGTVQLEWHTDEAFDPPRFLLLMGLRNPDRVATLLASERDLRLSPEQRKVLADERFRVVPDDQHIEQLAAIDPGHEALTRMRRLKESPVPVAVLPSAGDLPDLRFDRPFTSVDDGDQEAAEALDALSRELDRVRQDIVLEPGDVLVVDNWRAAHGRAAYKPRDSATARWLLVTQSR